RTRSAPAAKCAIESMPGMPRRYRPTIEGEATAHYLAQLARARQVRPSRLAQGLPLGGELEYVDRGTLSHAFGTRSEVRD
ncbi:hypothetical protein ACEU0B_002285, partial [Stenotrophomonas indicatrix]